MTRLQLNIPRDGLSATFLAALVELETLATRIDDLAAWAKSVTPPNGRLDEQIDAGVQMSMDILTSHQDTIYKTLTATPCLTTADTAVKAHALLELIPPEGDGDLSTHLTRSLAKDVLRLSAQTARGSQAA